MKDPNLGYAVWPVPDNKEVTVTLFKDPRTHELEDKSWTFILEEVRFEFLYLLIFFFLKKAI